MENLLLKKLKIKAGFHISIINAPANLNAIIGDIPEDVHLSYGESADSDGILIFSTTRAELNAALSALQADMLSKVICWIFYPKAKTKLAGDLNLMKSWDDLKTYQLAPCASAAIDGIWTGLRIKPEADQKKSGLGNAEILQSDYSAYIDIVHKKVILPADVKAVLETRPEALQFYEELAYSHRKEYILWILTAKQEKTRTDRIHKMLDKLLSNKKNPGEK